MPCKLISEKRVQKGDNAVLTLERFHCGVKPKAFLHTHGSGNCSPSDVDFKMLELDSESYGGVICSPTAVRFYFRWENPKRAAIAVVDKGPTMSSGTFGLLMSAGVLSNAFVGWDRDPGIGPDPWTSLDKPLHGLVAFGLASAAMQAGVRPRTAAIGVCLAGAVFELTQGYASRKDVAINCAGAAIAWGWRKAWP